MATVAIAYVSQISFPHPLFLVCEEALNRKNSNELCALLKHNWHQRWAVTKKEKVLITQGSNTPVPSMPAPPWGTEHLNSSPTWTAHIQLLTQRHLLKSWFCKCLHTCLILQPWWTHRQPQNAIPRKLFTVKDMCMYAQNSVFTIKGTLCVSPAVFIWRV